MLKIQLTVYYLGRYLSYEITKPYKSYTYTFWLKSAPSEAKYAPAMFTVKKEKGHQYEFLNILKGDFKKAVLETLKEIPVRK